MPRHPRRVITPQRRTSVWFAMGLTNVFAGGNAKTQLLVLNAAALALRPFTVIRTRLWIQIISDQSAAAEVAQGAFGLIVVQEEASAAGAASVPGTISETDASFFVYEPFVNTFDIATAVGFHEPAGTQIHVDSKAMRKVGISEDVVANVELRSAPAINIAMEGRMLVKLH